MPFIRLSYQEGGIRGRVRKREIKKKLKHTAERQKRETESGVKWG